MPDYDDAVEVISDLVGTAQNDLSDEEIQDVSRGLMLALLAITDNQDGTLIKVGKANPWHIQALKILTGSKEEACKPLSDILRDDMGGLELDALIDVSGITKGGHFLDTQGYIAHNDDTIVLSYRCTTSAFDWLTNFNSSMSIWEIDEDLAQGHSGCCSGFTCCLAGLEYPKVHTGFYNNFLASVPIIDEHIMPLLANDQPPRKLYVVGHSLGAGVATLAACHFLLHKDLDWNELPQTLVNVTAGSPRACSPSMRHHVHEALTETGDSARMYRVVKGKDIVTQVPPKFLGFVHLVDPIQIVDDDGPVIWKRDGANVVRTNDDDDSDDDEEFEQNSRQVVQTSRSIFSEDREADEDEEEEAYQRLISKIPAAMSDHMPDKYLKPILKRMGVKYGSTRVIEEEEK